MENARVTDLKLRGRLLFPKVFNAASRAHFHGVDDLDLPRFLKAFIAELRALRIAFEIFRSGENLLLVERAFLILVVSAEADIETAVSTLREKMQAEGIVLIGFVIQLDKELRWRRVQISEKWLKMQNGE